MAPVDRIQAQKDRVAEIRAQLDDAPVNLRYDEEGFLVVQIPQETADANYIAEFLYVDDSGNVAEASLDQPHYYVTMQDLLDDAASREDSRAG